MTMPFDSFPIPTPAPDPTAIDRKTSLMVDALTPTVGRLYDHMDGGIDAMASAVNGIVGRIKRSNGSVIGGMVRKVNGMVGNILLPIQEGNATMQAALAPVMAKAQASGAYVLALGQGQYTVADSVNLAAMLAQGWGIVAGPFATFLEAQEWVPPGAISSGIGSGAQQTIQQGVDAFNAGLGNVVQGNQQVVSVDATSWWVVRPPGGKPMVVSGAQLNQHPEWRQ